LIGIVKVVGLYTCTLISFGNELNVVIPLSLKKRHLERPSLSISTPFLKYMMLIDIIIKED
jgi:hypothetical protein